MDIVTLTHRDGAILRAIRAGTGELTVGVNPDLYLDGRCCCDQLAARRLAHAGLITTTGPCRAGYRAPARLTSAGYRVLAGSPVISTGAARAAASTAGQGRESRGT